MVTGSRSMVEGASYLCVSESTGGRRVDTLRTSKVQSYASSGKRGTRDYNLFGGFIIGLPGDLRGGRDVSVVAIEIYTKGWKTIDVHQNLRGLGVRVKELKTYWFEHQTLTVWSDDFAFEFNICAANNRICRVGDEFAKRWIRIEAFESGDQVLSIFAVRTRPSFRLTAAPELLDTDLAT